MQTSGSTYRRIALLIALGAVLHTGGVAAARDSLDQQLTSPNGAASGRARVSMRDDSDGRLVVSVRGLAPNQSFDVLVGTVKVGTLRSSGGGQGSLRFRTRPRGRDLLLGFDPRGAVITVRDTAGVDVLVGGIPAGSSRGRGNRIICCDPDDRGAECEDRTAETCLARGGTIASATSCMPNPCASSTPPAGEDIICCIPDDNRTECEDRTPAECAAQGGIAVSATSCTPNPCAAIPPVDPDIQCCLPDDSGTECEDRTPAQCAAQGGVNMGPGNCSTNPCGVVSPTPRGDDHGGGDHGGGGHGGGGNSGRGGHDDRGDDQ